MRRPGHWLVRGLAVSVAACVTLAPATVASAAGTSGNQDVPLSVVLPQQPATVQALSHVFLDADGTPMSGTPSLQPGETVTLVYRGVPDGDWLATLYSTPRDIGFFTATNGLLEVRFTVPADIEPGDHSLELTSGGVPLSPAFAFGVPFPATNGTGNQVVANTGGLAPSSPSRPRSSTSTPTPAPSAVVPANTDATPPADEDLVGIMSLSGIKPTYRPSLNPFDGTLDLQFTIQNNGSMPLVGDLHAWVDGPLGATLGSLRSGVALLQPGASRAVRVTIPNVGQLGSLSVHVEVTPKPAPGNTVDEDLRTVSRETTVWAVPWLPVAIVLLVIVGVLVGLRVRRVDGAVPPPAGTRPPEPQSPEPQSPELTGAGTR